MTIKADLSNTVDKANLLREHLSNRTVHDRPTYVTSQIAFYDASQLSGVPDSDGLVSIVLDRYVQTNKGIFVTAMQNWIEFAVWTPVPGGLKSYAGFKSALRM